MSAVTRPRGESGSDPAPAASLGRTCSNDVQEVLEELKATALSGRIPVFCPGEIQLELSSVLGTGAFGVVYSGYATDSKTGFTPESILFLQQKLTTLSEAGDCLKEGPPPPCDEDRQQRDHTRTEVAIKIVRTDMGSGRSFKPTRSAAAFKTEAAILCKARHHNIVRIWGIGATEAADVASLFLLQRKVEGPCLSKVVEAARNPTGRANATKGYSDADGLRWVLGVARGLHYLHTEVGVLHRDIKGGNVILSSHDPSAAEAVIIDFGVSSYRLGSEAFQNQKNTLELYVRRPVSITDTRQSSASDESRQGGSCPQSRMPPAKPASSTRVTGAVNRKTGSVSERGARKRHQTEVSDRLTVATGTPLYMAPEQRGNSVYDCEAEVYSLGLLMYEVFNRITLQHVAELEGYRGTAIVGALRRGWRPPALENCPASMATLIDRCTQIDPSKRPRMPDVVSCLENFEGSAAISRKSSFLEGAPSRAKRKMKAFLSMFRRSL